jgi:hypothetical protein
VELDRAARAPHAVVSSFSPAGVLSHGVAAPLVRPALGRPPPVPVEGRASLSPGVRPHSRAVPDHFRDGCACCSPPITVGPFECKCGNSVHRS